jgi:hypothetical protein
MLAAVLTALFTDPDQLARAKAKFVEATTGAGESA